MNTKTDKFYAWVGRQLLSGEFVLDSKRPGVANIYADGKTIITISVPNHYQNASWASIISYLQSH